MLLAVSGAHFMHGFVLSPIKKLKTKVKKKKQKKMREKIWRKITT